MPNEQRGLLRFGAYRAAVSALVILWSVTATGVAVGGVAVGGVAASGTVPAEISWSPCAEDATADCGVLTVPVDWADPDGPKIDLAMARRRATRAHGEIHRPTRAACRKVVGGRVSGCRVWSFHRQQPAVCRYSGPSAASGGENRSGVLPRH